MNTCHGDPPRRAFSTETRREIGFENPMSHRFAQMAPDHKQVGMQSSRLLTFLPVFFLTNTFAFAQAPNVRVRLYSLHSEQRIKVTARTAELKWKTCEQCEAKHAPQLDLMFSATGVKINGIRTENHVFVEGDYRIEPS